MTSTTFSGKTFPTLYKWSFKRNRAVMIVFSVLMAIGILIDLYIMSQMARYTGDYYNTAENYLNENYGYVGLASIVVAQAGAMAFTFISSLMTFSFLHNKRSVDMFGAIPTTRGTMFASHLLGGLSAVALPFTIGSVIVTGITCRSAEFFVHDILAILGGLLGMTAAYLFTILIAYCCGTTFDTAIITLSVNAIYAGTIAVFWEMACEMISGLDFEGLISTPILALFAPYSFCFFGDYYRVDEQTTAYLTLTVWSIIFIIGMFFLTLKIAQRRHSEVAQSDFDVKWLPIAIKVGASVVSGSLVGVIAASESNSGYANMIIYSFWYVIIGLAAFFILHVVFARGLKGKLKNSMIAYICATVVSLGFAFALTTGMGIDTYVPNTSNVKSVMFAYDEYSDPENIKTIAEIHKEITKGLHADGSSDNGYPYYLGSAPYHYIEENTTMYDGDNMIPKEYAGSYSNNTYDEFRRKYPLVNDSGFSFTYEKKFGFNTTRYYYLSADQMNYYDYAKIEELLKKLRSSEEYKKLQNEVLWDDEARERFKLNSRPEVEYCAYFPDASYDYNTNRNRGDYNAIGSTSLYIFDTEVNKLYDAIAKDILADKEYYKTQYPSTFAPSYVDDPFDDHYLTITFNYAADSSPMSGDFYVTSHSMFIVVPDSYTNTLKVLAENGISNDFSTGMISFDDLTLDSLLQNDYDDAVSNYNYFGSSGSVGELLSFVKKVEPQIEIKTLYKSGYNGGYLEWSEAHSEDFSRALVDNAKELYDKYKDDPEYTTKAVGYTNRIMENYGIEPQDGQYFCLEDKIIKDLLAECDKIMKSVNSDETKSADSDTSKASENTDTEETKPMAGV